MNNQESKIKPVEDAKGFKVINVPRKALEAVTGQIKCVCDDCLRSPEYGYYVAVLNHWLCPICYCHWKSYAKHYKEDVRVEKMNYDYYMKLLQKFR